MEVKIGSRWEGLLKGAVESGRFASVEEAVAEALRLLDEQEDEHARLKAKVERAIEGGGRHSLADVEAAIEEALNELDIAHA
jgi:putative addiction module CopG family antidote